MAIFRGVEVGHGLYTHVLLYTYTSVPSPSSFPTFLINHTTFPPVGSMSETNLHV